MVNLLAECRSCKHIWEGDKPSQCPECGSENVFVPGDERTYTDEEIDEKYRPSDFQRIEEAMEKGELN